MSDELTIALVAGGVIGVVFLLNRNAALTAPPATAPAPKGSSDPVGDFFQRGAQTYLQAAGVPAPIANVISQANSYAALKKASPFIKPAAQATWTGAKTVLTGTAKGVVTGAKTVLTAPAKLFGSLF
jgi:hypothetical protein